MYGLDDETLGPFVGLDFKKSTHTLHTTAAQRGLSMLNWKP